MSKQRIRVSLADKRLAQFCRAGVCFKSGEAKELLVDELTLARLNAEPKLSVTLYPQDKTAPADDALAGDAPADDAPAKPTRQTRAAK